MFYRVDYVLALVVVGAISGVSVARLLSRFGSHQIARAYYLFIAVRVCLGALLFICTYVVPIAGPWGTVSKILGDVTSLLLGALFGLAMRRARRLDVLYEPQIYSALCLSAGYGILIAGVGKALSMQVMSDFFVQSGYSLIFLKFIMVAEILGGAALLVPWAAAPALMGIGIDMMGAIITHIHNGDPLDDSTGAIAALLRLAAIVVVWILASRASTPPRSVRTRFALAVAGLTVCVAVAIGGSDVMRHTSQPRKVALATKHHWRETRTQMRSWTLSLQNGELLLQD